MVEIWDLTTTQSLQTFEVLSHADPHSLDWHPNGKWLAIGGKNVGAGGSYNCPGVWDVESMERLITFAPQYAEGEGHGNTGDVRLA